MGDFMNEKGTRAVWDPMYDMIKYEYPNHRVLINQWWPNYNEELSRAKNWLDNAKVRLSVGTAGNGLISNAYAYLSTMSLADAGLSDGGSKFKYTNAPTPVPDGLTWERNTTYNIGVDLSAWKGLLGFTADAYYSRTTNMLFDVPVSSVSGLTSSNMNIGSMENKGFEINASSRHSFGSFHYDISGNISFNRNKVLSLGENDAPIIKAGDYSGSYYITKVGEPVGCYYLLIQDGVFHNRQEMEAYPHFDETVVGDFRFVEEKNHVKGLR